MRLSFRLPLAAGHWRTRLTATRAEILGNRCLFVRMRAQCLILCGMCLDASRSRCIHACSYVFGRVSNSERQCMLLCLLLLSMRASASALESIHVV